MVWIAVCCKQVSDKMSTHWGELQVAASPSSASSVVDMEALAMKAQSIQVKGPHLHQPSAQQKLHVHPLPAELCRPDNTSLHTIDLLKHGRQIRARIIAFQHQHDNSKADDRFVRPRLPSLPPQPQMPAPKRTSSSTSSVSGPRDRSGYPRLKLRDGSIEIDSGIARQLSRRAVATICAHSGFEMSQESSLETLTDVLNEFMTNTCRLLRVAVDREALTGHTGFQDTLTQVFHEIGVGSTDVLFNFWRTRIQGYHTRVLKQTEELRDKYEEMKNPSYQMPPQDDKSPRVKEEPMTDISFQDPQSQSQSQEDQTENQSESSSSETPSNQPLSFHSLNALDLEDAAAATTVGSAEVVDENSGSDQWYSSVKEEDPGDENGGGGGGATGGMKKEVFSGDESSQDVKTEEPVLEDSPHVPQTHSNVLDADSKSPVERKLQLHMPPRKKKKK